MIKIFRKQLFAIRTNKVFRGSISMFFYASVGTILAAVVYYISGVRLLSVFLFLGGLIFAAALLIYMKGLYKTGIITALAGVSIISVAGDVIMGIECGAHYFLLSGAMLFVSADKTKSVFRIVAGVACFIEFTLICVFLIEMDPVTTIPYSTVFIIDKVNLIVAFGAIGFSMHNYAVAVLNRETIQKKFRLMLQNKANSDQLTGLPNRRFTYKKLELLAARSNTRGAGFVIGLADIDDFKLLNDTYGHLSGDAVLAQAGALMKNALRKNDIVGRWGGEEFLIVLPNTGIDEGLDIVDRLRSALEKATFDIEGHQVSVTMTIGVSAFKKTSVITDLIREADENMYKGKNRGKNCIMCS